MKDVIAGCTDDFVEYFVGDDYKDHYPDMADGAWNGATAEAQAEIFNMLLY